MGAYDRKTPVLTRIVQPSGLTLEDLADTSHPVNEKSMSGKSAGMGLMIGDSVFVATGSGTDDAWNEFNILGAEEFPSGWAVYQDDQYTEGSPFVITSGTTSTIPDNSNVVIDTYEPSDGALYTSGRITPNTLGSSLTVRLTMSVASSVNNGAFSVSVDISAAGDGSIEVARHPFRMLRGANDFSKYTIDFNLYALGTFIANGGTLHLTAEDGNISIADIGLYIVK
ncbi:hypothetical protein HOR87_gp49 [Marinomonas phage CB5A]|uniref:Tail fiber protein n=3 Tax=Murciavirus TaxID=2731675 RepID=A0A1W5S129_9CAUD|nr:hypothetical protein HOR72_gp26 [Marinomonas phage CPP1m]YP_009791138.1 hypothetical protein HOR87_gp49 [Marinomonas phage CB5A]ARB11264.1 hypothetical protein [Marinomonas phage CPP1m]ARB11314.1 hypothetical protein [Marinomonas phage CPG1g]ASP46296.1 hypothetical protein [Marinomonas phage CB5A]